MRNKQIYLAKELSRSEARRIAGKIAKLPTLTWQLKVSSGAKPSKPRPAR